MTGQSDARQAFLQAMSVSRETLARLDSYAALLAKWNPAINLVAPSTLSSLWSRHFLDSAQIFEQAPENAMTWLDMGTGGGFPGLIVAVLAAEKRPDLQIACAESDLRKATFLRTAARDMGVTVNVLSSRIEEITPLGADVVSARALAPLPLLLSYAHRHLKPQGTALFLKGAGYRDELNAAKAEWLFDTEIIPSKTDDKAVILKLGAIRRA